MIVTTGSYSAYLVFLYNDAATSNAAHLFHVAAFSTYDHADCHTGRNWYIFFVGRAAHTNKFSACTHCVAIKKSPVAHLAITPCRKVQDSLSHFPRNLYLSQSPRLPPLYPDIVGPLAMLRSAVLRTLLWCATVVRCTEHARVGTNDRQETHSYQSVGRRSM